MSDSNERGIGSARQDTSAGRNLSTAKRKIRRAITRLDKDGDAKMAQVNNELNNDVPTDDLDRWTEIVTPTSRDVVAWKMCDHGLWEDWDRPLVKILRFLVEPSAKSQTLRAEESLSHDRQTAPVISLRTPGIDLTFEHVELGLPSGGITWRTADAEMAGHSREDCSTISSTPSSVSSR